MSYSVKTSWKKIRAKPSLIINTAERIPGLLTAEMSCRHLLRRTLCRFPMSVESAVDPEEAFVASLSSCHMLWFLSIAAGKKYIVESYEDNAEGILGKDEEGKLAMTKVTLKPKVNFGGNAVPLREQIDELHHLAHEKCFIANSVKTKINIVQI